MFIHITKNAGTSMIKNLKLEVIKPFKPEYKGWPKKGHVTFGHLNAHLLHGEYPEILPDKFYDNAFKFSFIRNPWDRLVSVYHHTIKHHNLPFDKYCHNLYKNGLPEKKVRMEYTSQQVNWLDGPVDFIGRYENMKEDWKKLCVTIYGKEKPLEKFLTHKGPKYEKKPYKTYYTDKLKNVVAELYSDDIEQFGYKF